MNVKIELEMDNAAFGEDLDSMAEETAKILGSLCERWKRFGMQEDTRSLFDSNGNKVGRFVLSED